MGWARELGNTYRRRRQAAGRLMIIGAATSALALAATTAWLADRTVDLHHADTALAAAEVARVQLGAAMLLAEQEALGLTVQAEVTAAREAAEEGIDNLEAAAATLPAASNATTEFATGARLALLELEAGKIDASRTRLAELGPRLEALTAQLRSIRNDLMSQVQVLRSGAAPVAIVATLIVIVAGPLAIIGAHRTWMQRRMDSTQLRQRLNAATELIRSKDEFLANVSHELRTPLTGIFGFARLLEDGVVIDDAERVELVALISKESDELLRMVDDILTLGRSDSGVLTFQPRLLNPCHEMRSVLQAIERQHGPVEMDCDDATAWADPLRLRQLSRNLASNAHKHGGNVIQVNCGAWLGRYRLVVRDNGDGVPENLVPNLFDRFVHGSNTPLIGGSIGLGLHIAKRLAEGMGGSLEYGRQDGWTEFTVFLPLDADVDLGQELADARRA